ncbi:MAG: type I-C CRISPR-associated protein Cas5 [Nitrospiraceae bacterium]|nr:MAG: type I-C CRISPR-associated protein Cas5 [Nitrospiraceae bacterium]
MSDPLIKSLPFRLKVWGRNACFTRPEMKVERVSYDVMTPSAARGVLEAILWKPAIRWKVTQIDVLQPIKWESVRRNEVGAVMSPRSSCIYVDDPKTRQQRAGLFLRDVAYTIHSYIEMTDKAGAEDNIVKFQEMFLRRAEKGQCFHRPYLGCREFAAEFEIFTNGKPLPEPIPVSQDLGWMLYDVYHNNTADEKNQHFCNDNCRPSFFRASLSNGRMMIDEKEVRS